MKMHFTWLRIVKQKVKCHCKSKMKKDKECTYNAKMRLVGVSIVAVESNKH